MCAVDATDGVWEFGAVRQPSSSFASTLASFGLIVGCGAAPGVRAAPLAAEERTLWVVAPHPDDEILMAAEALSEAVRTGAPYEVVIVTNGDFSCTRDGWARQEESIAALATLGVTEDHVHFLGYPDGWLANLGPTPLAPLARTAPDGSCGVGDTTYGARGREHADVHSARTGAAAPYTSDALVSDLSALFTEAPPGEIHLPHALDGHPDHAMTYAYVRRALAHLHADALLVRHVVHAGPCWPASDQEGVCVDPSPALDATPLPPLPPPLSAFVPDRIVSADAAARRRAIGHYVTQLEAPLETSWLASFARTTEVAWIEPIVDGEPSLEHTGAAEDAAASWRAPVMLSSESDAITLASGEDAYLVRRSAERIELLRVSTGTEVRLRAMETPPTPLTTGRLALRAIPLPSGFVALEVHGTEGFLLGAIDPAGIRAGDRWTTDGEGHLTPLERER